LFKTIANIFRIPDLRKKILITALLLVLYRLNRPREIGGVAR